MMGGEIVGWKNTLALTPYGTRFREYRKFIARIIGTRGSVKRFHPLEEKETQKFLARVLADPHNLSAHARKYVFCML
jgi:hypothetical protein